MTKKITFIYFRDGFDLDAVDEICERFCEADLWYDAKYVRFVGTSERLQEFIRAVRTVEEPIKIK